MSEQAVMESSDHADAATDAKAWIDAQRFFLGVEGFQEAFADFDIDIDGIVGPQTIEAVRLVRDRGGFLSANFHLSEFRCSHCDAARVNRELVRALQRLRDRVGPLDRFSSFRCPEHHLSVGLPNSQHVGGSAWDPKPYLPREFVEGCGFSGIGISHVDDPGKVSHLDVRHASRVGNPTGSTPDSPALFPDN
jgi:hypothetical protein